MGGHVQTEEDLESSGLRLGQGGSHGGPRVCRVSTNRGLPGPTERGLQGGVGSMLEVQALDRKAFSVVTFSLELGSTFPGLRQEDMTEEHRRECARVYETESC